VLKVIFSWILPVNQESVTLESNNLAMLNSCENTTIQQADAVKRDASALCRSFRIQPPARPT